MAWSKPNRLPLLFLLTSAFLLCGATLNVVQDETRKVSVLQLGDGSLEVAYFEYKGCSFNKPSTLPLKEKQADQSLKIKIFMEQQLLLAKSCFSFWC